MATVLYLCWCGEGHVSALLTADQREARDAPPPPQLSMSSHLCAPSRVSLFNLFNMCILQFGFD